MQRLPAYLHSIRARRPAWYWAAVVALLHAVLWLGFLLWRRSAPASWQTAVDVAGLLLSSLLVGLLAWWVARLLERAFDHDSRMRERLFEIIDCLPDPAGVRDLKGRYVLWNRAAEQYYGLKASYVVGQTMADLYPLAMVEYLRRIEREALTRHAPVVERIQLPALYGHPPRLVRLRVAPVHSGDGQNKLHGIVSILHDITDEEHNADAARRQAAQLRLALAVSGLGAWDLNTVTQSATYSDSFVQLLRYQGEDFARSFSFRDRLHPQDRDGVIAAVQVSIEQGTPFDQTFRLLCFDDQIRRFRGCGEALTDAWGDRHFAGLLIPLEPAALAAPSCPHSGGGNPSGIGPASPPANPAASPPTGCVPPPGYCRMRPVPVIMDSSTKREPCRWPGPKPTR